MNFPCLSSWLGTMVPRKNGKKKKNSPTRYRVHHSLWILATAVTAFGPYFCAYRLGFWWPFTSCQSEAFWK